MMTSLFTRSFGKRRAAGIRRGRSGRRSQPATGLTGWVSTVSNSLAGAADQTTMLTTSMIRSSLTSMASLEQLEQRAMRAGMDFNHDGAGTLAIWLDQPNEQVEIWSTDGSGRVTVESNQTGLVFDSTLLNDRGSPDASDDFTVVIPTKIMVYEEHLFPNTPASDGVYELNKTQGAGAANSGGTGYTTAPSVSLDRQTDGSLATFEQSAQGLAFLGINTISGTAAATGLSTSGTVDGKIQQLSNGNPTGAEFRFTYNLATKAVTGITAFSRGGTAADPTGFTDLNNVSFQLDDPGGAGAWATVTGLSATGFVDFFDIRNTNTPPTQGSGYWADVLATFSGGGGTGAQYFLDLSPANTGAFGTLTSTGFGTNTAALFQPNAGSGMAQPVRQDIYIGASSVPRNNYNGLGALTSSVDTSDTENSLSLVEVNTPISTVGGDFQIWNVSTYNQNDDITVTGSGDFEIWEDGPGSGSTVTINGDVFAGGSFLINSGNSITFGAGQVTAGGVIDIDWGTGRTAAFTSTGRGFSGTRITIDSASVTSSLSTGQKIEARNTDVTITSPGDITLSGSGQMIAADSITIIGLPGGAADISLEGSLISGTDEVEVVSLTGAVDILSPVSSSDYVRIVSDTSTLNVTESVSSGGSAYLQSEGNLTIDATVSATTNLALISNDQILGLGRPVADRLTVIATKASDTLLNTSVNVISTTTNGTVTISNDKSLTTAGIFLLNGGDLSIETTGTTSDLDLGTLTHTGGDLTLTAGRDLSVVTSVSTTGNVSLGATAGSITATQLSTPQKLRAEAELGIDLSGSVSASTFALITNLGDIELRAPSGGAGNVTVVEATTNAGNISLRTTTGDLVLDGDISTAANRSVSLTAADDIISTANTNITTGTLTYLADNSSATNFLAGTLGNATFHTIGAELRDAGAALTIVQTGPLNVTEATTKNADISITTTGADLIITGDIDAGTGDITLSATGGGINATGTVTGAAFDVSALNSSGFADLAIDSVNATVTGTNESLTIDSTGDLVIGSGDVSVNGGLIAISLTDGNLTRTGELNATATGSVRLDVGTGSIGGTGNITANLLDWTAASAPSATGLSYSALRANQTAAGDLAVTVAGDLTIEGVAVEDGNVSLTVTNGNLTINGDIASRQNVTSSSVTLSAGKGGISSDPNATVSGGDLTVTSNTSVTLQTDINSLDATVGNGSLDITEADGLTVDQIDVDENVTLLVSNGNLTLAGDITAGQNAANFVNLTVPNGAIVDGGGSVNVTSGSLLWTATAAPDSSGWKYSDLAAHVTGAGNPLNITVSADLNLLSASTHSGDIKINLQTNNLTIEGNVTAGTATPADLDITDANDVTVAANATLTANYVHVDGSGDIAITVDTPQLEVAAVGAVNVTAQSDVAIVNDPSLLGDGLSAGNDVTVDVAGNLAINAEFLATGLNVSLTTTGGITSANAIEAANLSVSAGGNVTLQTRVGSLSGNMTGSLNVTETDGDLAIGAAGLTSAGDVSLTLDGIGASLNGTGSINAAGTVTLSTTAGITLNLAAQITGTNLTITAGDHVAVGTNVDRLAATLTGLPSNLTVVEADDLEIAATGLNVSGGIEITANGTINGAGSVTAEFANGVLGDIQLTSTNGAITLAGVGQIKGETLTVSAATGATLGTEVAAIDANITGTGALTVTEVDDLQVLNATASNGPVSLTTGGDISGAGSVTAGNVAGNAGLAVTINAGGTVNLSTSSNQVSGASLALTAGNGATIESNVSQFTATVTGDLSLTNGDDLEIVAPGVTTTDGDIALTVSGDLSGNTTISANAGQGNVVINATGDVAFGSASLLSADQLNLTANDAELNTDIRELVGTINGNLTLTETNGLTLGAENLTVNGDANISVSAGDLNGTGVLNATGNSVVLDVAGSIDLGSNTTEQVVAENLTASAGGSITMNVNVGHLAANAAAGDLIITETDGFNVSADLGEGGIFAAGNSLSLTSGGNIAGLGDITANDVTLVADAIDLSDVAQLIEATALDVTTTTGNSALSTNISTLVANVAATLTITEQDDLQIGAADGDEVLADNIAITLSNPGNLTSAPNAVLNGTTDISAVLQADGFIDLTAGIVRGGSNLAYFSTANGAIDLNTDVGNLSAQSFDEGGVTVTEADDLIIAGDGLLSTEADVSITLSSGNLTIDSGGIIAGQLSDVTLNVSGGAINSVNDATGDFGIVIGRSLTFTAQNASSINTSVSEITGAVTGANESLTIHEEDGVLIGTGTNTPIDGLLVGDSGLVSNGGDITLTVSGTGNIAGGNLTLNGVISAAGTGNAALGDVNITVENGSITSTTPADFIEANVATISAANDSLIETRVNTINATITGNLVLNELNSINGTVTAGVLTLTTGNATLNQTGSATLNTTINTLTASVSGDLTIVETDDLQIGVDSFNLVDNLADPFFTDPTNNPVRDLGNFPQNVVFDSATTVLTTNNGAIDITAGGNITGNGSVIADGGTANVTLNASGDILLNGTGQIQGDVLNVTAGDRASLGTNVNTLVANVTNDLDVTEVNNLLIGSGDVVTTSGNITISTANNLSGPGSISAADGSANVTLTVTGTGSINLSTANQVTADTLSVTTAQGDADLGTNIATLVADVVGNLTVSETDNLVIGQNVVTNPSGSGSDINITAGGDITGTGRISAANGASNVTLNATGDITLTSSSGQIVGDVLNITAANATVNTSVGALTANVSGNLVVVETDDLFIDAAGVTAGNVTITTENGSLDGGQLQGGGTITAQNDVTLSINGAINLTNGGAFGTAGFAAVTAETLNVTSSDNAVIDTEIDTLVADVTGSLTIAENSSIQMGTNVEATDSISITANNTINGTGYVNATNTVTLESRNANVVLDAVAGQINADAVDVTAQTDSSLNTSVNSLTGNVAANLTVVETNGLAIGPANLVVGGNLSLTLTLGDLTGTGSIDATDNVSLNIVAGGITMNAVAGQVAGDRLAINAANEVNINTAVNSLTANITGVNQDLTVNESDALVISADDVVTNNGNIAITTGSDLTVTGDINTTADVTLNAGGTISGLGRVTADDLNITAQGSVTLNTTVASLATDVTGDLVIEETDDLVVNGIAATSDISLNLATGDLNGTGVISAGDDITLNVSSGFIDLDAVPGQVTGDQLTITAENSSSINTKVTGITANITGTGETLTINEFDDLEIVVPGLQTDGGDITVTVGNDLTITGAINVIPPNANVTLNVAGTISGTGLITADRLNVTAGDSATLSTNIAEIDADITGSLVVTETNGLSIVDIAVTEDLTLTLTNGNLAGPGNISAGDDITLSVPSGEIDLDDRPGQIAGDVLTFTAQNSSVMNTAVRAITGSLTQTGSSLIINELNALDIAAGGITVPDGQINITTGGALRLLGDIDALTNGNVTLDVGAGATSAGGAVKAAMLNLTAVSTSSLDTSIGELKARITGLSSQDLTITESDGLVANGVTTTGGDITLKLDAGDLDIRADISGGDITLETTLGAMESKGGNVIGDDLVLTARDSSSLNTSVTSLAGTVTKAGQTLTIRETNELIIAAAGVSTNDGDITLNIGQPGDYRRLTLVGDVNAGSGDIDLIARQTDGGGTFVADNLSVTLNTTSILNTNVTTLSGTITDSRAVVQIYEANDLQIGTANLTAQGVDSFLEIDAGGGLSGPGSVIADNGTSRLQITTGGNIALDGRLDTGSAGFITLSAGGGISMNDPVQIEARRLTLTAVGDVDVGTNIAELSATVTGASSTLTVREYDGMLVLKNTAVTNNGLITIEAGNQATGDLNVRGPVNAGNNDVVLINQRGNITGAGLITGRNLEIQVSGGSADVATNVDGLTATVATAGETLTVQESDGLTILAGNVTTNDGDVSLTVSAGDLIGDGSINAGTGNVTLSVPAGEVIINPGAEIIANVLDVDAAGGATLRTNVDNLSVDLTAVGAALTVSEADDIGILGIETNNGDVSITAAGSINGTGGIDAGTGDILLDAGNGINIAGAVVGDDLDVTAGNNAELNTNVNTLHGTVGGNLNVSETDGLVIPAAGITAGNLTLDLAAGDLSGTGDLEISESVNLFARDGSVTFNSRSGQVEGTDLNVSAATSANVRTDVDSVVSNQTGSLTIEEVNGLDIGAAGIDTSAGNGAVSITLLRGDLTGNGIDAGEGNITIDARRGAVDLSAGTVAGNALELTAYRGPVVLNTDLDRINALVTRNGDLTITEADDLIVDRARVNRGGSVSINITGTGNLTIAGDVQATGRTGDVVLETNNGDVTLGPDGTISTRATLDLTGVNGSIVVEPGTNSRRITTGRRATDVQMNPGQYVDWQLDASDTTQASIRTVIDNINRFSGNSVIDVQEATSIELTRSLPAFRNSVTIKGNDNLTLSGSNDGNNRLSGFTFRADGSSVSNVTLNDFGRTAVTLIGGRSSGDAVDMQVSNVTINNSQTGLRAVNYFGAAATFENNTIDAQSRVRSFGVLLAKARGFTVDNNTISGTHIGIQISSRSEGTTVSNNTISGRDPNNGYGISLLRATGLLGDILDVDGNKIDDFQFGIFASGFCTYSTVQNTDFTAITGSPISLANQYNVSRSRNLTVIV